MNKFLEMLQSDGLERELAIALFELAAKAYSAGAEDMINTQFTDASEMPYECEPEVEAFEPVSLEELLPNATPWEVTVDFSDEGDTDGDGIDEDYEDGYQIDAKTLYARLFIVNDCLPSLVRIIMPEVASIPALTVGCQMEYFVSDVTTGEAISIKYDGEGDVDVSFSADEEKSALITSILYAVAEALNSIT